MTLAELKNAGKDTSFEACCSVEEASVGPRYDKSGVLRLPEMVGKKGVPVPEALNASAGG